MSLTAPTPTIDGAPVTCECGGTSFITLVVGMVQCSACHTLFETSGFDAPAEPGRATPLDPGEELGLLGVPIACDSGGHPVEQGAPQPSDLQQVPVRYDREDLVPAVADGKRVDGERRLHGSVRRVPVTWDDGPTGEIARCDHGHVRISAASSCAQILLDDLTYAARTVPADLDEVR